MSRNMAINKLNADVEKHENFARDSCLEESGLMPYRTGDRDWLQPILFFLSHIPFLIYMIWVFHHLVCDPVLRLDDKLESCV